MGEAACGNRGVMATLALSALLLAPPVPASKCPQPAPLGPLPGCAVRECRAKEFDEAELQSGPAAQSGEFDQAFVQGETAVVTYVCPASLTLEQIAARTRATVKRAGYTLVYSGGMALNALPGFTARRGRHWIQVVSEPFDDQTGYTVTSVQAEAVEPPERPPARRARKPIAD